MKIENYPEIWSLTTWEMLVLNNSNLQRVNYEYEIADLSGSKATLNPVAKIKNCDS